MKFIKILLSIIVIIALVIVVGSFFLPKNSRVERSVMVATADSVAYNYVLDFASFNDWSPWYEAEPTAKIVISGPNGEVGEKYAWVGKEVGEGNFVVTKLEPYSAIYQELTFIKPFEAKAENNFKFEQLGDSTKVSWIYDGVNKGIVDKWMGLMMDGMLGKDYEKGLNKLKVNIEK